MIRMTTVVLIAEIDEGETHPAVLDLAALGRKFAENGSAGIRWLMVGNRATETGHRIAKATGYPVTAVEIPLGVASTGELLGNLLEPFLKKLQPQAVVLLHTSRAQDYAAALAIALDAACITGVQGIAIQARKLLFQRAVLGGRWQTETQTDGRPVILTVLPGFFRFDDRVNQPAEVETYRPSLPRTRTRLVVTRETEKEAALSKAETILAAGRGVGTRDNLDLIYRLAALLPRSAVAGSRIVCDAGWMPYGRQVGVTGATVAPDLYLACGISGAFQHLAGMSGARFVVAVNSDSRAAIFNAADIGVVEDLTTFLPLLIQALEAEKTAGRK